MVRASCCEDIVFCAIANTLRDKGLLTPEVCKEKRGSPRNHKRISIIYIVKAGKTAIPSISDVIFRILA